MVKKKTTKYTPREAQKKARDLGWTVAAKQRSGDLLFRKPDGETFTSRAPGRADRVPLVLAKALDEADQNR